MVSGLVRLCKTSNPVPPTIAMNTSACNGVTSPVGKGRARVRAITASSLCSTRQLSAAAELAARRLVLVRPLDEIGADRGGVLLIEHRLEGRHAGILHRSVEHDLVEEIGAEEGRLAKVRSHAAAHCVFAAAGAAVLREQATASSNGCRIGGCRRRIEYQLLFRREHRKRRRAAYLAYDHPTHVAQVAGLGR